MTDLPVIADAGPLIGLARVGLLPLLGTLYGKVQIPAEVLEELQISEDRPGSRALRAALAEGWLESLVVTTGGREPLILALGAGEAAAILLAEQRPCRFLLIDEQRGRMAARKHGLRVVGTGGILLAAKQRGLLDRVSDALDRLAASGYRISTELRDRIAVLAGEGAERG